MASKELKSFLGLIRKSGNIILGSENVKKAIFKDKIKAVFVPCNTSENTLDKIISIVKHKTNIKIIYLDLTKEELNDFVGKYVSIIGVKDQNMISKVEELISQDHEEECVICKKNTEYMK